MTARVLKRNGDLASLKSRDAEMLNDKFGHPGAYWSHDTTGGVELITRITIDPVTNNGARAGFSLDGMSFGDWLQAYRDMYAAHDTFYRERFRHRCVGFTPLLTRWSTRGC